MLFPVLHFSTLLLPGLLGHTCGPILKGLTETGDLNRVKNGNTAPKHSLPWQVKIQRWDRVTTGTDLVGLVAEIAAYGLIIHRSLANWGGGIQYKSYVMSKLLWVGFYKHIGPNTWVSAMKKCPSTGKVKY